jgi:hypothetical protein
MPHGKDDLMILADLSGKIIFFKISLNCRNRIFVMSKCHILKIRNFQIKPITAICHDFDVFSGNKRIMLQLVK